MAKTGEYQGGFYAIISFIGVYVRCFIFKIWRKNKSIKYLSGEENFPKLDKKQRYYSLIVGFIFILLVFSMVIYLFILLGTANNALQITP
jgi:hypothetical protein